MTTTALLLMVLTIVSKIVGFGRELALSYTYGASSVSDAYIVALSIPGAIFGMIVAGIMVGYIPMYSKLKTQKGDIDANRFTSNVLSLLLLFSSLVLGVGLLFTENIVKVFATGFSPAVLNQTVQFTRITFFSILFTGIIQIFTGYLQVNDKFLVPSLLGFPANFFIISFIFLSKGRNPNLLVVGIVFGALAQILFLLPSIKKSGYTHTLKLDLKSPNIRELALMSIPIVLGSSVHQINVLIDRTLASQLETGGISALNYAERLNGFVQGIFVVSIVTVLYPMISKMVASGDLKGVKKSISEALVSISLLVIPVTIGILIFSTQIVTVLFGYGAFGDKAIQLTSSALFFYSVGMISIGFQNVLVKVFYSMEDTKSPVFISMLGVGVNVTLNVILSKVFGLGGLALATSLASVFVTALLFIKLRKKIGAFGMRETALTFVKIIFASSVMGVAAKLVYGLLEPSLGLTLSFAGAVGVGAVLYVGLIFVLKIDEVTDLLEAIRKKRSKK